MGVVQALEGTATSWKRHLIGQLACLMPRETSWILKTSRTTKSDKLQRKSSCVLSFSYFFLRSRVVEHLHCIVQCMVWPSCALQSLCVRRRSSGGCGGISLTPPPPPPTHPPYLHLHRSEGLNICTQTNSGIEIIL